MTWLTWIICVVIRNHNTLALTPCYSSICGKLLKKTDEFSQTTNFHFQALKKSGHWSRSTCLHSTHSIHAWSHDMLFYPSHSLFVLLPCDIPTVFPDRSFCVFLTSPMHTKSSPITGLDRPTGFQDVEAPRFLDNLHMKVVRLSAIRTGRLYPPPPPPRKYSWSSFLLEAESTPGPQCGRKDYVNEKNSTGTIGNRTRDLPVCSAVPKPPRPMHTSNPK
jgi:hypothetical protein